MSKREKQAAQGLTKVPVYLHPVELMMVQRIIAAGGGQEGAPRTASQVMRNALGFLWGAIQEEGKRRKAELEAESARAREEQAVAEIMEAADRSASVLVDPLGQTLSATPNLMVP